MWPMTLFVVASSIPNLLSKMTQQSEVVITALRIAKCHPALHVFGSPGIFGLLPDHQHSCVLTRSAVGRP